MLETTSSLLTIARVVNGTTDLTEGLRLVCRELARLTLAETVAAYLLDVAGKEIRPVAAYHVPKHTLELLTTTTLPLAAQGFAQSVFTAGHVAWSDDVQHDPRFAFPLFRAFPHRSGLIIPLSVDGAVAGAFDISDEKRVAQAERQAAELRAVAALATAAAHEINNPLAIILGQLTMLEREHPRSPRAAKIVEAAERIRDIVARMMNITRLEAHAQSSPNLPPMLDIRKSRDVRDP